MSDKKSKILHITFNMGIGGTEQVIRQIIENSDVNKFEHEILCIDGNIGSIGSDLIKKGIVISKYSRKNSLDFGLIKVIKNRISTKNINVLHCHQYTPFFYGLIASLFSSTKVIFTEHGRFYPDIKHPKRRFINPFLFFFTNHVTAISRSTASAIKDYEYYSRDDIKVIYNGINPIDSSCLKRSSLARELSLDPDCRYVGTISRLDPIKNQLMMINAFSRVRSRFKNTRLLIIGDGEMRDELKSRVSQLKLEDDVIFTGFINNPQRFILLMDVFLLSSFSEGTSMTLLESMSLSIPSVVTDVGGNPEIVIDHKTGIVVPTDSEIDFAEGIMYLLSDPSKLDSYGKQALMHFNQNFNVIFMVEKYQKLYLN